MNSGDFNHVSGQITVTMRPWKRADISDRDVCRATEAFSVRAFGPCVFIDEILAKYFDGCPPKVIWSAMERAEDHGLLDCGTSIRTAWLSEKGKALLGTLLT